MMNVSLEILFCNLTRGVTLVQKWVLHLTLRITRENESLNHKETSSGVYVSINVLSLLQHKKYNDGSIHE